VDHCRLPKALMLVEEALRLPAGPQSYAVQAAIGHCMPRGRTIKIPTGRKSPASMKCCRISPSPVIELNHAAVCRWSTGRRGHWI